MSKLTKMFFDGQKRFEYVDCSSEWTYKQQQNDWEHEFGLELPSWDALEEFGTRRDLRILAKTGIVITWLDDGRKLWFQFDPGFITDFASVPAMFRGLVDQDDVRLLPAVLVHDYLFTTQKLGFKQTNRLFLDIAVKSGYPKWRAWLAYGAVSSPIGRFYWRRYSNVRRKWTAKTAFLTEQISDGEFRDL